MEEQLGIGFFRVSGTLGGTWYFNILLLLFYTYYFPLKVLLPFEKSSYVTKAIYIIWWDYSIVTILGGNIVWTPLHTMVRCKIKNAIFGSAIVHVVKSKTHLHQIYYCAHAYMKMKIIPAVLVHPNENIIRQLTHASVFVLLEWSNEWQYFR